MGMLAAAEMWPRRDHKAEWNTWQTWLDTIANRVKQVPGVTTRIELPDSLSNNAPTLVVEWNAGKLGITGQEVSQHLYDTEPRVIFGGARGSRPGAMASSISVMPYMMQPGDDKVAAERLYAALAHPPRIESPAAPSEATQNITGRWDAVVDYQRGHAAHTLTFEQKGDQISGTHQGEIIAGDLRGGVAGNLVHFAANHNIEGTSLHFGFQGKVEGERMAGMVDLGEYGQAKFTAQRHSYQPLRGDTE